MSQQYGQQRPNPTQASAPAGTGANPYGQYGAQPLPPTGIQQQMASWNQGLQFAMGQQANAGGYGTVPGGTGGTTSLQQMANNLARQYGLPMGRGNLFNEQGMAMMTPEQLAQASGGAMTMGSAAAIMQNISNSIASYKTEQATKQAQSTLASGMGLVQQRGRGSLATMQSGMYSQMASLYANQEYEAADFSYYIQKEQQMIEMELRRKEEKRRKRGGIFGGIMGLGGLIAAPFTGGATLGLASQGLGIAATGWI